MNQFTAFFDANVFFSPSLRSFLMYLTLEGLYRAKWSDLVHEEWIKAVLEKRTGITREQLERTRDKMNEHAGDCLVTGFEGLIDCVDLPDRKDRHVLAAAIRSGSQVIVTRNLKDFPADRLALYGIEAQHPDDFIMHQVDLDAAAVLAAAKAHRASLRNPPKSAGDYLDGLERQELTQTVSFLRDYIFNI
jgi:hypothetical protein